MIITVTGHRPNKLGGYSKAVSNKLTSFAARALNFYKPEYVITGMALGWDQAVARAAVNNSIPFVAAVPFKGQENIWPEEFRIEYQALLARANDIVIISDGGYSPIAMQKRNEWMVDQLKGNDDFVLALWDGTAGGTRNCVLHANSMNKTVINLWQRWLRE